MSLYESATQINLDTNYTRQFNILIDSFNFVQHITYPTHIAGNIIDLIISHAHSNLTNSHSIKNLFSDHNLVFFHISSPRPTRPIINTKYRKYNNIWCQYCYIFYI